MPDLYAGLLILAAATLAFAWASLRRGERLGLIGLYLAAITFHQSHLLLAVALAGIVLLLPASWPERRRRLACLALPVPAAVLLLLAIGWFGFGEASLSPRGPPFLLARSWEDGPARSYLAAACPEAGWAICAELGRLAPTAQEFLWRQADSYWSMEPATRAAVRAEEKAILLRAVLADPIGQLRASLANATLQLGRFGLDDFVLGRGAEVTAEDYTFVYLPRAPAAVWGLSGFTGAIYVTTVVALLAVIVACCRRAAGAGCPAGPVRRRGHGPERRHLRGLVRSAPTLSGPRDLAATAPGRRAAARLRAGGQPISRSACATSSLISTSSRRSAPSRRFISGDAARGAALVAGGRGSATGATNAGSSPWPGRVRRARSSFCAPLMV